MEHWSIEQTTAPTTEPVSVADAMHHCRVDTDTENTYIGTLVKAARRHVESVTGRQLITATWKLYMDRFYDIILLPRPPLQSVSSVGYTDTSGSSETVATSKYDADTKSAPARLTEAWGESWPTPRLEANAVTITYDAGYGNSASDVPEDLIHAIKLLVGHFYENREQTIVGAVARNVPRAVDALLAPYKVSQYGSVYPGVDTNGWE